MLYLVSQIQKKLYRIYWKITHLYFPHTFIFIICGIWIFLYIIINIMYFVSPIMVVYTKPCGPVRGVIEEDIYIFKGIPYAHPPIKNLRWQKPVPLCHEDNSCWNGIYPADRFGKSCMQDNLQSSENCLYLNIWTPSLSKKAKLAVLIFLHGGCLLNGNGSMGLGYMPTSKLVSESGIVYVSLNYRLNAFGFMALDILSKISPNSKSGNYGLWDQIQAFKWIKDNIINFGGNPEMITIFGHSSGGTSLFAHLSSPHARGLFHRVWISSGSPLINVTLAEASKYNLPFLKNSGCDTVECLLKLSANKVLNDIPMKEYPYWDPTAMTELPTKNFITASLPIVDGDFLLHSPAEVWSYKEEIDIPVIIGNTAQEVDFYLNPDVAQWTWEDYKNTVKKNLNTFNPHISEKALLLYPTYQNTVEFQYTTMITDLRVICPTNQLTLQATENFHSPIYRYIVTSSPSKINHFIGNHPDGQYSIHGWDAIAFFGGVDDVIDRPTKNDYEYQKIIQDVFFHFIKTGKIKQQEWQPYPKSTALISHKMNIIDHYHKKECDFWLKNGFEPYAWQN